MYMINYLRLAPLVAALQANVVLMNFLLMNYLLMNFLLANLLLVNFLLGVGEV